MAIEPKSPRKRAVKKASAKTEAPVTDVTEEKKTTRKKAAAIPVAIFQAAPEKPAAKKAAKAPAAPAAQTTLNPQAAWPFPTASKP